MYTDDSFRGRLQCDLQLARKGQIECTLADLWLNDTGEYQCVVVADRRRNYKNYDLEVTGKLKLRPLESSTVTEH